MRCDTEMLGQQRPKTGCIENSAGADDPLRRQAGNVGHHLGHNIDRIGDNQQDGLRCVFEDSGYNILKNFNIALQQLQAGLARFLRHPAGQYNQISIFEHEIITGCHPDGFAKWRGMQDIFSLRSGQLCI